MHLSFFIYDFPTRYHILPTVLVALTGCECCDEVSWHVGISWMCWDIGILF